MPAVLCSFAAIRDAVDLGPDIATAVAAAATGWITDRSAADDTGVLQRPI
jgi:hypothetical protein